MGDRATVTLKVLHAHKEEVQVLFDNAEDDSWIGKDHTFFEFTEVNYGTLTFLSNLIKEGIAFDSVWKKGSGYGSGTESCRFTSDGDIERKEIFFDDINMPLEELIPLLESPDKLQKAIKVHAERVSTLPWDNQEQYGKLYKINQLILPKG